MEKPDINIVTIEDPIEFDLENINQAQVNTKSGVLLRLHFDQF